MNRRGSPNNNPFKRPGVTDCPPKISSSFAFIHTKNFGRRGDTVRFRPQRCTAERLHPEPGDPRQLQKLSSVHLVLPASRTISCFPCPASGCARRKSSWRQAPVEGAHLQADFYAISALSCRVLCRLTHRGDEAGRVGFRDTKMIRDSIVGRFACTLFVENRIHCG
jgi:hypothetical protein